MKEFRKAFESFAREKARELIEAATVFGGDYVVELFETGAYSVIDKDVLTDWDETPGTIALQVPFLTEDDYDGGPNFDIKTPLAEMRLQLEEALASL